LGKPTKDAIVSVQLDDQQEFQGGVIAAAEHAKQFCKTIHICEGGTEIKKERWVESQHVRKLFEMYRVNGCYRPQVPEMSGYDVVVVLDYGHGFATQEFINALPSARYCAANVQTNSGNYGFNLATKYTCLDYLCVDEPEARLATQNRDGPIEDSLPALGKIAQKVVVTLGKSGAIGYQDGHIVRCAAFTDTVVDTIGAGDAFFAVTALVAEEADMMSLLRIGNAAGALKAKIVGHRKGITKHELIAELRRVS
jgi:bifunctional ADP-heptose synthase (sugar kinase/adenylyltransferase)